MNRKELMQEKFTGDKSTEVLIENILKKDVKVISRAKRDIQDKIDELEEQFNERLSSETPLDKSVVEVQYLNLKEAKTMLKLYKTFEKEFLSNED